MCSFEKFNTSNLGGLRAFLVFLATTALFPAVASAEIRALVDSNRYYAGDTVRLTLEAPGQAQGVEPDLSPLHQDFEVLGSRTSTQIQIVNGRRSDSTQWIVELEPKRTGLIRIPPIKVGAEHTRAVDIQINPVPAERLNQQYQAVIVEAEIAAEEQAVYVQQQIRYKVRLMYSQPLLEAALDDPKPTDAVVEKIGDDKTYRIQKNGRQYQVIERQYAIFPEKSGNLRIPPVAFKGRVASNNNSRNRRFSGNSLMERFFNDRFFSTDPFGDPGKRIVRRTRALSVEVKPRPDTYSGQNWLPAAALALKDSWVEKPPEFKVGEPVTRTLTLEAKGLAASQLPEINISVIDGMKVYPEQPSTSNRTDGVWLHGRREQSMAFIPSQAGELTLPEIRLAWWDTVANRERVSSLPPWKIRVQPAATTANRIQELPLSPQAQQKSEAIAPVMAPAPGVGGVQDLRTWILGGLGALALLVLAFFLGRRSSLSRPYAEQENQKKEQIAAKAQHVKKAMQAFETACVEASNPQRAAKALLAWVAVQWPEDPPRNLGALASRLASDKAAALVRELDQALYARSANAWEGKALWAVLRQGLQQRQQGQQAIPDGTDLAPLYPR